jgi:glycosyltransferase involved in cell wall biosynthesis
MKIAIDSGPLSSGHSARGVGAYTRELLKALNMSGVDVGSEDLNKYDVVHFTSFKPFEVSIPFSKPEGTKFVLTIYDLTPLIYPKHYPPGVKGRINWLINKYLIRKNIDAVITISETSKKDISRFIGIDPKKIHVTYLAPKSVFKTKNVSGEDEIKKKYNLSDRFALYGSDINYNKNIPVLLKACKLAIIPLVMIGKDAKEVKNLDLEHAELSHLKGIDWTGTNRLGYVPDEDLPAIYKLASVYVLPSLYEGFGMPMLEAFAAGTPVVAAKTQALLEIGEGAAVFADPKSPEDFAEKIQKVLTDKKLRDELIKAGKAVSEKFSWEKTAKETLKVYKL